MANKSVGEVLHAVAVRMRVIGSGNLEVLFHSLDDINNAQLNDIPMALATNREPTVLANFEDQRVQLELRTLVIDEVFTISKIVIFVKPIAKGYPIV